MSAVRPSASSATASAVSSSSGISIEQVAVGDRALRVAAAPAGRRDDATAEQRAVDPLADRADDAADAVAEHDRQVGRHRRVRRTAGAQLRLDERHARQLDVDDDLARARSRVGHAPRARACDGGPNARRTTRPHGRMRWTSPNSCQR